MDWQVQSVEVREDGLVGKLFLPTSAPPYPRFFKVALNPNRDKRSSKFLTTQPRASLVPFRCLLVGVRERNDSSLREMSAADLETDRKA